MPFFAHHSNQTVYIITFLNARENMSPFHIPILISLDLSGGKSTPSFCIFSVKLCDDLTVNITKNKISFMIMWINIRFLMFYLMLQNKNAGWPELTSVLNKHVCLFKRGNIYSLICFYYVSSKMVALTLF